MRRILVIRSGALGDSVVTLPAIGALRERWPGSHIEVIGTSPLLQLVDKRYYADRILSIEERGFSRFFARSGKLPTGWTDYFKRFDLVVCFVRDALLLENIRRSGARNVVGASLLPGEEENKHAVDCLLDVIKPLRIPGDGVPRVFPNEDDRHFASVFWEKRGFGSNSVVAIHPGSGSEKKMWPVERFGEIAKWLVSIGMKVVIPSGEADEEVIEEMVEGFSSELAVAAGFNLLQLAAIFERCRFFVGNDSGLSHLASAAGVPVICIFGPTNPVAWAPRGKVTVVRTEVSCSPCSREKMSSCTDQICLSMVGVEAVRKAAEEVLR